MKGAMTPRVNKDFFQCPGNAVYLTLAGDCTGIYAYENFH